MTTYQKNKKLVIENLNEKEVMFYLIREHWKELYKHDKTNQTTIWDFLRANDFIDGKTWLKIK